jgi:hypothetical protein
MQMNFLPKTKADLTSSMARQQEAGLTLGGLFDILNQTKEWSARTGTLSPTYRRVSFRGDMACHEFTLERDGQQITYRLVPDFDREGPAIGMTFSDAANLVAFFDLDHWESALEEICGVIR